MARPLRLEFHGALYHITSRGDGREAIYLSDEDRELSLDVLSDVVDRFNWVVHAYCLMGNHYHLLVETPDANLAQGMRQFNGVYTQRFNRRHTRVGHVFQGRYKAIIVQKEQYLLELARYVVLNPVRAGMVRHAVDWPWSSYRATVALVSPPCWLMVDWVLSAFSASRGPAIAAYAVFVDAGMKAAGPWAELRNQIYLGDEHFVARHLSDLQDQERDLSEIPLPQRRALPRTLPEYAASYPDRDEALCQAYSGGGYSLKEIGDYFGLHYSRVSRIVATARAKRKT